MADEFLVRRSVGYDRTLLESSEGDLNAQTLARSRGREGDAGGAGLSVWCEHRGFQAVIVKEKNFC